MHRLIFLMRKLACTSWPEGARSPGSSLAHAQACFSSSAVAVSELDGSLVPALSGMPSETQRWLPLLKSAPLCFVLH